MTDYIYDQGWERERARLAGLEAALDPGTIQLLERIGVAPGWRCLEVGGGGGSITDWLCHRVGATGLVVATDLDTRFLTRLDHPNLEVRRHDVVAEPLETDAFELVHSRDVLEHLPDRDRVLRTLVDAVRPGGWILLEDVDLEASGHGLDLAFGHPPELAQLGSRYWEMGITMLRSAGVDPSYGRKLPGLLRDAGLVDVGADLRAHLITSEDPEAQVFRLSLLHFRPRVAATGMMTTEQLDRMIKLFEQPGSTALMPIHVAAWGRRPD